MAFRWRYTMPLRLRSLFRRNRVEDELEEEIRYHIDERTRELMAKGLTEREARLAALRAFDGVEQRKEECRDTRRVTLFEDLRRDVGYAGRMMRRSPAFTVVAVVSLALGIGANTAIFSILDVLSLRTLPIADPDRLVILDTEQTVGLTQFLKLRELTTDCSGMSAVWTIDRSNIIIDAGTGQGGEVAGSDTGQARIGLASADYFSTMGLNLAIGRAFTPDEERTGRPVAVISDTYWRRRFARTPDITGRTFRLNGETYDIVGVAPPRFTGEWVGMPTDMWVPFTLASRVMPEVPGGAQRFPRRVLARLKPGVTIDQAQAAARVLYRQILVEEAGAKATREELDQIARAPLQLESAARGYSPQRQSFAQPLAILAVGVCILLLIACANLANLLLARSAGRQREIAVRLAIGAGRGRLVRQMLTESLVLSAAGGVLGVLLAVWAEKILMVMVATAPVALGGAGPGLFLDLSFDIRALAFTIGVCLVSVFLFGMVPAFSASRIPLAGSLTSSSGRLVGGARFGPSTLLVVAQIALSLLLLIGAGLFARTLANLRAQDLGFERQRELLVWTVPGQTGRLDVALAELWYTVQQRLSTLPGVVSAAASNQAMLRGVDLEPGGSLGVPMRVEGEPPRPVAAVGFRSFITPGFFQTLGVPIVAGRDFTERDTESAPRVAIINQTMARFYFGDGSAVGRLVRFPWPTSAPVEIVGVAADYARGTPRGTKRGEFATYFPYRDPEALNKGAQSRLRVMLIVIRTNVDPLAVAGRVRAELLAIDPELPVLRINTTEQHVEDVLAQDRLVAVLSSVFGVIAVSMACLGLFGLISYRVARRTSEIGVRLALGATRRGILSMILAESGRLVLAGLGVGLVCAFFLAKLVASRLYGVGASDPLTVTGAMILLIVVAAVAALIPARRAAGVDPLIALRFE